MKMHEYFRRWLEIPISGTLDICMLSKSKFGLDIINPSTKFIQYKSIHRNLLKNSKHGDTRVIYKMTSHTDIKYDRFNSTREIVKIMRSDKQDKIKNIHLNGLWCHFFGKTLTNKHQSYDLLSKAKCQKTSLTLLFVI